MTDATGATVCATTTADSGAYACTLTAGARAPLVLQAVRGDRGLYSATANPEGGTVNLTPLTTIIVSRLSPDGDPASLAGAVQADPAAVTAEAITAQSDALLAALKPLLDALGISFDPVTDAFAADGTGQDQVLDSLAVTVRPADGQANIEITVKTLPAAADSPPLSIAFGSGDAALPSLPSSLRAADLAAPPPPDKIADLFVRLNACYALPLSQRVNAASDDTPAVGGPADVIAPVCRGLFVGSDPASYVANGVRVGRNAANGGAFSSLFRPGATGVKWEPVQIEFYRPNGDAILTYRWIDSLGNSDNETLALRDDGGTLRLTGNTNTYGASVRPYSEDREFINTPQFSYYTTGYNISIDNRVDASGNPVFSKVLVHTPQGATLTYLPTPGLSYLVASIDGTTPTGTPLLRFAGQWRDTGLAGNPNDKDPLIYVSPQYTDAQIRTQLQDQSVWTLEFFHADSSKPNVVQHYRTISRAETIEEVRRRAFAQLTPGMKTFLSAVGGSGVIEFGAAGTASPNLNLLFFAAFDGASTVPSDAWTVPPAPSVAPTLLAVLGRAPFGSTTAGQPGLRFNDAVGVPSTARQAQVYCQPQTAADKHCDTTTAPGISQYAQGTTVNLAELWARDSRQVEVSKKAVLYKLQ